MGESDYGDVELSGAERERALTACKRQIASWQLAMPEVTPLVLNFGLDDFYGSGLIEYWVADETDRGYCGKFLFVFDGQECPCHRHEMKHETFFVMKGSVEMTVNGKARVLKEGDVLAVPPGDRHSFRGVGPALLLEVSQPSVTGDNFFENEEIGEDGVI